MTFAEPGLRHSFLRKHQHPCPNNRSCWWDLRSMGFHKQYLLICLGIQTSAEVLFSRQCHTLVWGRSVVCKHPNSSCTVFGKMCTLGLHLIKYFLAFPKTAFSDKVIFFLKCGSIALSNMIISRVCIPCLGLLRHPKLTSYCFCTEGTHVNNATMVQELSYNYCDPSYSLSEPLENLRKPQTAFGKFWLNYSKREKNLNQSSYFSLEDVTKWRSR